MKIAFFTDTYLPQLNGVAIYLGDAIKELSKRHKVILFAPGDGHFRSEKKHRNFKIYWVPSSPFPFYEGYKVASLNYKRVEDTLKKEKPDIVHVHAPINLGLQGLFAAKRTKVPSVITYHTHFPDYVPHLLGGRLPEMLHGISKSAVKRMIKHVFRQADAVTAPTKELAEELRSYGLRNVTYIPDGVDYGKLKCTKNAVRRFRKSHRIPNGKKIVLYLGRLSFEKNVDTLLEAFKRIERDDRVLLVAGGGPYLKRFKELAHDLRIKNIIFTGFVEGIGSAYSCGDIFVSASQSETFGLTFVEAMHFGLPAVGTRKFGPQELIKDGKTGFLVKPGSMVELANAMDKLLDDDGLRSRMSKAAVESSKDYSIGKSIAATTKLYKKLKRSGLPSQ